jgi:hypothetical protein
MHSLTDSDPIAMAQIEERIYFFHALNDVASKLTQSGLSMKQFEPMVKLMAFIYRALDTREKLYQMHHQNKSMVYLFKILEIVYALQLDNIPLNWKEIFILADEYSDKNFEDINVETNRT